MSQCLYWVAVLKLLGPLGLRSSGGLPTRLQAMVNVMGSSIQPLGPLVIGSRTGPLARLQAIMCLG